MKPVSLVHSLCLISVASLFFVPVVQANQSASLPSPASTKLRDLKQPAKTIKEWLAQSENTPSTAAIQVTGVKLDRVDQGLDITLETADSKPLQVDATKFRAEGKSLIADIPNAVLALPNAQEFSADNPTGEIATVRVTQTDASTIRVSVVGTTALPTSDVTLKVGGLAYSLNPEGQTSEEELVVTGAGQRGYRAPNSTTATKTDTPLRDIPQSIQIVPRQVLQDQQVTNLSEALRNVPGVAQGLNSAARGQLTGPLIRGFNATNDTFRDGLRDITTAYVVPDVAGLERIEVLKGPGSVLYGQGSLGGLINLVTKKPLSNPFYSVEFSAGSFNFYRGAIDLSGPLNDSKTILYRLNLAAQASESFLDFYGEQRYFVAPVLTFQLSDRTKLTLQAEYDNRPKKNGQAGLPVIGAILPNPNGEIPRNRNIGEPDDTDNQRAYRVGYDLEHRFSDNWQLRHAFSASVIRRDRDFTNSTALAANNRTLTRIHALGGDNVRFFNVDTYVVGKFATGSIQHQLVTGFNLNRSDSDIEQSILQAASLNIFNPIYGRPLGAVLSRTNVYNTTDLLGIYVQDQINLTENLKLLLGARYDTFKLIALNRVANTKQDLSDGVLSPRVGIVYQPIQPISLYFSYSRAFNPVSGIAFNGSAFQPENGTQYEVGLKADVTDRLSATLAFFDLTRSNVLTTDPTPGRTGFSAQPRICRSQSGPPS